MDAIDPFWVNPNATEPNRSPASRHDLCLPGKATWRSAGRTVPQVPPTWQIHASTRRNSAVQWRLTLVVLAATAAMTAAISSTHVSNLPVPFNTAACDASGIPPRSDDVDSDRADSHTRATKARSPAQSLALFHDAKGSS